MSEVIDIEKGYRDLKERLAELFPEADLTVLDKAWNFAKLAHTGQKRFSGEPYVTHALKAALILTEWKLDLTSIIAALLHDSVEDGAAELSDINKDFGEDVAYLVDGVTKVSYLRLRGSRDEQFVENLRKMFLAMSKDLRVVFVKLADRVHNMETLKYVPEDKQRRIAQETLEVYAPLAERLGMGEVKAKLDDLAFPFVYPDEYRKLLQESQIHYKKAEEHIKRMKNTLLVELMKEKIESKIDGRKKHLYSLWRKLERPGIEWDFSKIHDIIALRILVPEITHCYASLGVVHRRYKPVPQIGISDFIAQPKPNGYRSIHTKVFGPSERIVEIQITTFKMYEENEYGIAAHWNLSLVKSKKGVSSQDIDSGTYNFVNQNKLRWVRQLVEWQKEIKDSKEFLDAVKFDALKERIFVFSPKGDVFDMPDGATPIDFAFAVHTGLPKFIKDAKVNGRVVPLNYKLKSGEVVEIEKNKISKPFTSGWLEFVATTTAKSEINKYLRKGEKKG